MLKFIYGTMGSSKTAQALIAAHNHRTRTDRTVFLLKPSLDTRSPLIESRTGLSSPCIPFAPTDDIRTILDPAEAALRESAPDRWVVIVDEAQFCTPKQVEQLRELSLHSDVYCYGLKTNFMLRLFAGSQRLLELADSIEEIEHVCRCGRKATVNALFLNGEPQTDGAEIHVGDEEYVPLCYECYSEELSKTE